MNERERDFPECIPFIPDRFVQHSPVNQNKTSVKLWTIQHDIGKSSLGPCEVPGKQESRKQLTATRVIGQITSESGFS